MAGLIISIIIFYLFAHFMPKHRTRHEILTTILFALLLGVITDLYLDVKYKLYWYFREDEIDWAYLIVIIGQAAILVIIINYFPVSSSRTKKIMYIVVCSAALLLLEAFSVYVLHILHYGKWTIWYSAAVYPCVLLTLFLLLRYVKEKDHHLPQENGQ